MLWLVVGVVSSVDVGVGLGVDAGARMGAGERDDKKCMRS